MWIKELRKSICKRENEAIFREGLTEEVGKAFGQSSQATLLYLPGPTVYGFSRYSCILKIDFLLCLS